MFFFAETSTAIFFSSSFKVAASFGEFVFTGKEGMVQCLVSTQAKYNHVLHAIPKVYIPFRAEF